MHRLALFGHILQSPVTLKRLIHTRQIINTIHIVTHIIDKKTFVHVVLTDGGGGGGVNFDCVSHNITFKRISNNLILREFVKY